MLLLLFFTRFWLLVFPPSPHRERNLLDTLNYIFVGGGNATAREQHTCDTIRSMSFLVKNAQQINESHGQVAAGPYFVAPNRGVLILQRQIAMAQLDDSGQVKKLCNLSAEVSYGLRRTP